MQNLQVTLAIIKPHAVKNPIVLSYVKNVLEEHFVVLKRKRLVLDKQLAETFYQEHVGKFFFNRLITFMTSGPVEALVVGPGGGRPGDAAAAWRRRLGPTSVTRALYAEPASLRAAFGLSDTRNVAHGSSDAAAAVREIAVLFPGWSVPGAGVTTAADASTPTNNFS